MDFDSLKHKPLNHGGSIHQRVVVFESVSSYINRNMFMLNT